MFPRRYFPAAYFAPRYFPPVAVIIIPVPTRTGETYDFGDYKFDHIGDENDIIEMVAIILLMVD